MAGAPHSDGRSAQVADIVRRKADQLRREKNRGADKPCVRCLHYEPGRWAWLLPFTARCGHPVFTSYEVNRVSGELVARSHTKPDDARRPGSLCGPEAFLFEERSKWRRFKQWLGAKLGSGESEEASDRAG